MKWTLAQIRHCPSDRHYGKLHFGKYNIIPYVINEVITERYQWLTKTQVTESCKSKTPIKVKTQTAPEKDLFLACPKPVKHIRSLELIRPASQTVNILKFADKFSLSRIQVSPNKL